MLGKPGCGVMDGMASGVVLHPDLKLLYVCMCCPGCAARGIQAMHPLCLLYLTAVHDS